GKVNRLVEVTEEFPGDILLQAVAHVADQVTHALGRRQGHGLRTRKLGEPPLAAVTVGVLQVQSVLFTVAPVGLQYIRYSDQPHLQSPFPLLPVFYPLTATLKQRNRRKSGNR